ncbi:NAD(P)/FAD-dependent oxidoreductase [Sphingobacterium siyangense]|uniref:FAD-dependent oxidoreductase n=1 Tax=Sphingobacterium siyangense TaxID=459529 RepID=UPI002FDDA6F6
MLLENKTVAIIGGGPGGLTLARLLQQKGISVKVYERDVNRTVRVQGATLDLHFESGLKALEAAGLLEVFKTAYRPDNDRYRVVDKNGTIYFDDHDKESTGKFGDEWFRPEIDRGPLREILLDSLEKDTVVWDSYILSLSREDNGWMILLENGKMEFADIVIGADGANSKIRKYVTVIEPVYSGITFLVTNIPCAETNTPKLFELIKGGKISALGGSKAIFLSTRGDGSLDIYISFGADQEWYKKEFPRLKGNRQLSEWFKRQYEGWDKIWLEIFYYKEAEFIPRPLFGMPTYLSWETRSDITLIGDAAHVLPPNGEGVNAAMLDALHLAENLTDERYSDLQLAISQFEKEMLARFQRDAADTYDMNEWIYSDQGLQKMVELMKGL